MAWAADYAVWGMPVARNLLAVYSRMTNQKSLDVRCPELRPSYRASYGLLRCTPRLRAVGSSGYGPDQALSITSDDSSGLERYTPNRGHLTIVQGVRQKQLEQSCAT